MPIPTPTRNLPDTAVRTEPGAAAMTVHPTRPGTAEASTVNLDSEYDPSPNISYSEVA